MWTVCLMLPCSWDVYCTCRMTVHTHVHMRTYRHTVCVVGFWLYAGASYCSYSCIIVSVLYRLLDKKFSIFLFATLLNFCQIFHPVFIESFTVCLKNLFLCLYILIYLFYLIGSIETSTCLWKPFGYRTSHITTKDIKLVYNKIILFVKTKISKNITISHSQ